MKNITQYKMYLKSLSSLLLLFSAHLLFGNTAAQLSAEKELMPFGWIQEKVDWTDAAHIWNPQKIERLKERGEYTSIFATTLWGPFGTNRPASIALRSDCDNVIDPGTIGYNQEFCEPNSDPDEIVSLSLPGGGSGDIEYIWLRKVGNGEWETIPGSTSASYDPGPLSTPTFFRRCVRRAGCEEYIETDIVHITFLIPSLLEVSKSCVEDQPGKYQVDLAASNVNVVTANGERIYPPYVITANAGEVIEVVATGDCGTIERTITDGGVDYQLCEDDCVAPEITLSDSPVCNADNASYAVDFTVTNADSVFVNGILQAGTGPDFVVNLPEGEDANIRAVNDCDSDTISVASLNCEDGCPITITIPTDENPSCNDDGESYTLEFTVEGADSVFVNELFYAATSGNTYTLTFPRGTRACIFAWKYTEDGSPLCRANREVEAPPCCDNPTPKIPTIKTECNEDNETYTLTFTVENADSVFVNGNFQEGAGPEFSVTLPEGQGAQILATSECDGQTLRAFRSVDPPSCDCPDPVITITDPVCDDDQTTYTLSFTVTNADSVFLNGELIEGTGDDFSATLSIEEDAAIRAVKDCGDQDKEANAMAPAPCCTTPSIVIDDKVCSPDSTEYTLTFTIADADSVFVNNELQSGTGPQYSITLPAIETASILAKNECAEATRQEEAICCPRPTITIETDDNPSCDDDGLNYTLDFTVTGADSVFLNEVYLPEAGPDYSVSLPSGTRVCIVAIKNCGGQAAGRTTREVEAPICSCPMVELEDICVEEGTTATLTPNISGGTEPYEVKWFDNADLQGDPISTENTLDVTVAGTYFVMVNDQDPECPADTASASVEFIVAPVIALIDTICATDGLSYTLTFSVSDATTVTVNGEVVQGDPDFSIVLPIDSSATIKATNECATLSLDAELIITPPSCECPTVELEDICVEVGTTATLTPNISGGTEPYEVKWFDNADLQGDPISTENTLDVTVAGTYFVMVNDQDPECPADTASASVEFIVAPVIALIDTICATDGLSYTLTFSVSDATTVTVNGEVVQGDPDFSIVLPIDSSATIKATNECATLSLDAELIITPPSCECPTVELEDICVEVGTTATLTPNISGGTEPYEVKWFDNADLQGDPISTENTLDVTVAGTYFVMVNDQDPECPADTASASVEFIVAPVIALIDTICATDGLSYTLTFSVSDATTVTVNGEVVQGDPDFSIVLPIDSSATIKATNECATLSLDAELIITPPSCECPTVELEDICVEVGTTATLTPNISGGTEPYEVKWFDNADLQGDPISTENTLDVTVAGTYFVMVNDQDPECPADTASASVEFIVAPVIALIDTICATDGLSYTLTFSVSDATTVTVNGEVVQGDPDFSIVLPIDSSATIKATNECATLSLDAELIITPPSCECPTVELEDICVEEGTTATLTPNISGGTEPYEVKWFDNADLQGDPISTENTLDVTVAGTYFVMVNDQDPECPADTASASVEFIVAPVIALIDTICATDGLSYTLTFSVSDATTVTVNGEVVQGDPDFSIVLPIDSSATIKATNECATLSLDAELIITPPSCECPTVELEDICVEVGTTATLTPNISGGTEPYEVKWFDNADLQGDPISTENTLDVTVAGTYFVMVNDQDPECPADTASASVEFIVAPVIALIDTICATDGLSYTLTFSVSDATTVTVNGEVVQGDPDFSIVLPIDSSATIKATNECATLSLDAELIITPPSCECPTVELEDICVEVGTTATLTPNISGGTEPYEVKWFDNADLQGDPISTENTLDVTVAGTYFVMVNDQDPECPADTASASVEFIVAPVIALIDTICATDGLSYTLTFSVSDATTVTVNGEVVQGDPDFSIVLPIDSSATIKATNECATLNLDAELNITPPSCKACDLDVEITASSPTICPGEEVTLTAEASGGAPAYVYTWTNSADEVISMEATAVVTATGTYTIIVDDQDPDCPADTTSITITEGDCIIVDPCEDLDFVRQQIFFPNAISPNNDGINDVLRFSLTETFDASWLPDIKIFIYNRWGEKLKTIDTIKDTWDGTFRGKPLPPDVYGYYFRAVCPTGKVVIQEKGNITILK